LRKDGLRPLSTHLAEKYRRDDAAVLASRKVFEDVEEHRQPNGETIYVQVLSRPFTMRTATSSEFRDFWDVSARRRAEEALRASDAASAASWFQRDGHPHGASTDRLARPTTRFSAWWATTGKTLKRASAVGTG